MAPKNCPTYKDMYVCVHDHTVLSKICPLMPGKLYMSHPCKGVKLIFFLYTFR